MKKLSGNTFLYFYTNTALVVPLSDGKPWKTPEKSGKFLFELKKSGKKKLLGNPRNPKKHIQTALLITFNAFLRTFNLFFLLTNTNYANITKLEVFRVTF